MIKVTNKNGNEYEVIAIKGDYTLLKGSNKYNPWIVAWNVESQEDGTVTWGQGYYLEKEKQAKEVFNEKANR